jgi:hypothetical protein
MKLLLDINISEPPVKIDYRDGIMMVGSCFTEHIGDHLHELKFKVMQNPNGILFDPASVASALISYIDGGKYGPDDLFFLNELWQSWQHHSRFSGTEKSRVLENISASQEGAHQFLKNAKWLIITLGTSFSYRLDGSKPVANCHRAPANWFNKYMMRTEETITALDTCIYRLFQFNPGLNILFTVSPVRHIRDGIIENNRSKARLLEAVHHLKDKFDRIFYFPAYELVIDVLRDYRFYDIDLVHPNYQATNYVLEQFMQFYVNDFSVGLSKEIDRIVAARRHKPFQPQTEAHRNFLKLNAEKVFSLLQQYPFLDLHEEEEYFSKQLNG